MCVFFVVVGVVFEHLHLGERRRSLSLFSTIRYAGYAAPCVSLIAVVITLTIPLMQLYACPTSARRAIFASELALSRDPLTTWFTTLAFSSGARYFL